MDTIQLDDSAGTILVATGSEDKFLKISRTELHEAKSPRTVTTIFKDPTFDGAIHALAWSPSHYNQTPESCSALLFATGAKESLFCYSVSSSSPPNKGAAWGSRVKEDSSYGIIKHRPAPVGESSNADCRIMAIDVTNLERPGIHLLLAGYSDGSLRASAGAWLAQYAGREHCLMMCLFPHTLILSSTYRRGCSTSLPGSSQTSPRIPGMTDVCSL